MRMDVVFKQKSFSKRAAVSGPGAVHIDETGIIVEGQFPRFSIPLVWRALREIICADGMRTIPFSRVISYSRPGRLSSTHRIVYSLPNHSKQSIVFKMRDRVRTNNEEFAARFDEYRAAAVSFTSS